MELRHYLSILKRRAIPILLTVLVAASATYARTDQTSFYLARSTIYVGASSFNIDENARVSGDAAGLDRIINTFSSLIDSRPMAEEAIALSGVARSPDYVVSATSVLRQPETNLLFIFVADPDAAVARDLSIGLAEAFTTKLESLEPGQVVGEGDVPSAPASIFERATLPTVPQSVSPIGNMMLAAVFGLVLAAGVALLVDYLDVTVKDLEDAEARLDLPVLGEVPMIRSDQPRRAWLRTARGAR